MWRRWSNYLVRYAYVFGFAPHGKGAMSNKPSGLEPFERWRLECRRGGEGWVVLFRGAESNKWHGRGGLGW